MSSLVSVSPRTLGDAIPGGLARSVALVVGGTLLIAASAQIAIPLPFTPVPLTLQTFAVLLTGAVLGSTRGVLSVGLFALVGMAGVPWFASDQSGWSFPAFGYVLGFVVAAWLVGLLAERGADRKLVKTIGLMMLGNVVIYLFGVVGLMLSVGMALPVALAKGVVPFLVGDAIKILLAAGLLPATWKLVTRRQG